MCPFYIICGQRHSRIECCILRELAKCGASRKNECRALHRLIHRTYRTLPVRISQVSTPTRIPGKSGQTVVNYPVLYLSSWAREVLCNGSGKMLLGGYTIQQNFVRCSGHSGKALNLSGQISPSIKKTPGIIPFVSPW